MIIQLVLQTVSDAKEILTIRDVTIIGVSFAINLVFGFVIRYLYMRLNKLQDERLEDHKEFTKEVLGITDKTATTVRQVNEILRITKETIKK